MKPEEFLGSGVPGHPREVNIQGWFLAGPSNPVTVGPLRWKNPGNQNCRQGSSIVSGSFQLQVNKLHLMSFGTGQKDLARGGIRGNSCSWSARAHGFHLSSSEKVQRPQPLLVYKKVLQYTSNLYGSTPPICIAVPSWLLSLEERETQQYTSHLYCSKPPICTAVRLPFVRQYASHLYGSTFEKVLGAGVTGKLLSSHAAGTPLKYDCRHTNTLKTLLAQINESNAFVLN